MVKKQQQQHHNHCNDKAYGRAYAWYIVGCIALIVLTGVVMVYVSGYGWMLLLLMDVIDAPERCDCYIGEDTNER